MEAPPLERRLAAILAADVEGYSRLMHRDEETTMTTLSARRAVVDELIEQHRGRIANTAGDSVLAEFASVRDAVFCALEIQKNLAAENEQEPEDRRMRFRIGVNIGDVMVKDGDLFGDGVNVAARLEGLIEGGGICVSRGVRDHLRHQTMLAFDDLGEQLVKNIVHPVRAFRVRLGDASRSVPREVETPEQSSPPLAATASPEADPPAAHDSVVLDVAFWETIKDSSAPEEFEAYLTRHPDGHFAELARARLAACTSPQEPSSAEAVSSTAVELAFWESIQDAEDLSLFAAYLEKYPNGEFVAIAKARLATNKMPLSQADEAATAERSDGRN